MIEIFQSQPSGRRGYSFGEFRSSFYSICEAHRAEGRAFGFAFILYDAEHPQVRKVLLDEDYWDALDAISGTGLTVFTFSVRERPRHARDRSTQSLMRYMVSVAVPDLRCSVQALRPFFGFSDPLRLPGILFFQVSGGNVIDSLWVELQEDRVEDSFLEIRDLIQAACDSVAKVTPDNARNDQDVFNLIKDAVRSTARSARIKRRMQAAKPTADLLSLFARMLAV